VDVFLVTVLLTNNCLSLMGTQPYPFFFIFTMKLIQLIVYFFCLTNIPESTVSKVVIKIHLERDLSPIRILWKVKVGIAVIAVTYDLPCLD